MKKVIFRNATEDDLDEIIKLSNECFDVKNTLEYAKKIFNQTKSDSNQIYIVGTIDDRIIAHAKITIIPTIFEDMQTFSILNHVCVKPEFRREHVATKLLKECERISKEYNCSCMELWSKNFREAAHACYYNYGFEAMDAKFFTKNID